MRRALIGPRRPLTSSVRIREATPRDVERIAQIHAETWRAAYSGLIPLREMDARSNRGRRLAFWSELLSAPLANQAVLVLEENGTIRGFVHISWTDPSVEAIAQRCEINSLYVEPTQWRRGFGSLLLEGAVRRLRREATCHSAFLRVFASNRRARRFYEAHGWRPTGVRELRRIGRTLQELEYSVALAPSDGDAPD